MDDHVNEFFSQPSDKAPHGNFHMVIALHNAPEVPWEFIAERVPDLSKGWHELAYLNTCDRIDFTRDYWLTRLPYTPKIHRSLTDFFDRLNDIGVFIIQRKYDDPYESHLVYCLKEGKGFFHGVAGAMEQDIAELQQLFPDHIIPEDYLAFLQIHNGFCKTTDTGVISTAAIEECCAKFQEFLEEKEPIRLPDGRIVNPKTLIPFYESFGMPKFQCFWSEWYPEQEMGNVYYSGYTNTLSDVEKTNVSAENMAFPTFLDWLRFYLEQVE